MRRIGLPLLLLGLLILPLGCDGDGAESQAGAIRPAVVFPDGWTVQVDLAVDVYEQARGLMFVEHLPDDRGMLFVYPGDDIRAFYMKNCKIPLDMIWLSADGEVVDISPDNPPCEADPCPNIFAERPFRYNLEVRGGLSRDHGLSVGDRLVFVGIPPG